MEMVMYLVGVIRALGIRGLLNAAWVAASLPIVIAFLPISQLLPFHRLLLQFARRGKTMRSSSFLNFTVPQRYFLHFYVVAVVWTTFLLLSACFYAHSSSKESLLLVVGAFQNGCVAWKTVFVLLLMEVQVLRRLYESIYVFNYSPTARMHMFGYLAGLFFYTAAPLSLSSSCAPELCNYFTHQVSSINLRNGESSPVIEFEGYALLRFRWCQWLGAAIFMWGWIHQYHCHSILGSLRKRVGGDEYVIPHGDWFEMVSCPHYLAEIIIYFGVLVATGGLDITIWLLLVFVVSNLSIAAIETHKWYQQKFENYPRSRFAILPLAL
ncbi:Polyprenol reductase 1 [Acorus gramineus]|uniref:Polyprenol reductase 1 n=1 Tax=Acorus gramineus TaxID=55184 RepID=A0AAV9BGC6_ACOGR|nr:Polyprenol reductase 1 [Acorus gramineus]